MGFARWNILPIVMTALNGISSLLYTKASKASERYQLWGLAALFLVLLYNSPAALVLYWTMNNLVALIKQMGGNLPQLRVLFRLPDLRDLAPVRSWIYYSFYAVCFYFALSTLCYYDNSTMTPIYLFSTLLVFLWIIQIWHIAEIGTMAGKRWFHRIALVILPAMIVLQIVYARPLFQEFYRHKLNIMQGLKTAILLISGLILGYLLVFRRIGNPFKGIVPRGKCCFGVFLAPLIFILSVLFLWIPALIYRSLPSMFEQSVWFILLLNGIWVLAAILVAVAIYRFLPGAGKWIAGFAVCQIAFFGFLYGYVIKFNFGSLDGLVLTRSQNLFGKYPWYPLEFILLMAGGWGIYRLLKKNPRVLIIGFSVLIGISTLQGLAALWGIATQADINEEASTIPLNTDKLLSFSKGEPNVVIFMLDMFEGNYVGKILEQAPDLKDRLEGFIWFPNTLSVSFYTNASLPVIMGGWEYEALNQNKQPGSLLEKNTHAYETMVARAHDNNMEVSVVDPTYFHTYRGDLEIMEGLGAYVAVSTQFRKFWLDHSGTDHANPNVSQQGLLTSLALFRVLPYAFKPPVYNKGSWFSFEQSNYSQTINKVSFLRSLPLLSNNQNKGTTFKFFASEITHSPYAISKEGEILASGVPDPAFPSGIGGMNAFYSAYWALHYIADFVDWMKAAEVYDNSRIILVSDHGNNYPNPYDVPYKSLEDASILGINKSILNRLNPVLMMKDFDSHGPVQTSDKLMSNGDTMSLAYGETLKDFDTKTDGRTLPAYLTRAWETRELQHDEEYTIERYFFVNGSIFDLKNWNRIR